MNFNNYSNLNKSFKTEKYEFDNRINNTKGSNSKYNTISQLTGIKPNINKMKKYCTKKSFN